MTIQPTNVNAATTATKETAPIKNVALALSVVRSLQARNPLQPNLGVFSGFSGYGKSVAALYCQNKTGAAYVEVRDTWTKAKLLKSILIELGIYQPRGTVADMEDEVIGMLARDPRRPLLIDEADLLIKRGLIELVRGIAKASQVPVMLIGEEQFPTKLEATGDRFRDLVLVTKYAQPVDLEDCRTLARTLYPALTISDALLEEAREAGEGRVRRVGNSLHAIAEVASRKALSTIDLADFKGSSGEFSRSRLPKRKEAA